MIHADGATDNWPFVQCQAQPVTELKAKGLIFVREAKFLGCWPNCGHLIGGHARFDHRDGRINPFACFGIGVGLRRSCAADVERPVIAGPIALIGLQNIEERLIARPDQTVGEVMRMRVAALAGNRVDRLHIVTSPFRRASCWIIATMSFSRIPGFSSS